MTEHELMHYGILGQKWGVRRYQNEDGTLTEKGKKRQNAFNKIDNELDECYKKSKTEALYRSWMKKHPDSDSDDFSDWAADSKQYAKAEEDDEKSGITKKISTLEKDKYVLTDRFQTAQAAGAAFVSSIYLSPIAMYAASKISEKAGITGSKKAAIVLATGITVTAINGGASYLLAAKEKKETEKKYDI